MKNGLRAYKPSAVFAMACGLVTMILGILLLTATEQEQTAGYLMLAALIINTVIHFESYIMTLKQDNRRQSNVLAMAIAEALLVLLCAYVLRNGAMLWRDMALLFSLYLVFNGTALMVLPSAFARFCGILAAVLAVALFFFGQNFDVTGLSLASANLIINGSERVLMSAMGGKRKNAGGHP